jgi:hypothetical protein
VKRGQRLPKDQRQALANQYKECAMPGFRQAMKRLYRVIKGFKPRVDDIIKRAKS